jgi:hypothetical protein
MSMGALNMHYKEMRHNFRKHRLHQTKHFFFFTNVNMELTHLH